MLVQPILLQSLLLDVAEAGEGLPIAQITIFIIVALMLLLLIAIVSGAETAVFSLESKDVNYIKTKDDMDIRTAAKIIEQPRLLRATIALSSVFLSIAFIISTKLLLDLLLPTDINVWVLRFLEVFIITSVLSFGGYILPKVYAAQNNMKLTLFAAPILRILYKLFLPVSRLYSAKESTEIKNNTFDESQINTNDFEEAIELSLGHKATKEEINIFKGILRFSNITVKQIMRTRLDIVGIAEDDDYATVKDKFIKYGYSRLPVYRENLDQITGMLYTKEFLPYTDASGDFDWKQFIHSAYYIHEGKLLEDLLKEFQHKNTHFAVVVDEYGGTSGIVTMNDIMEEIIGEMRDEFDETLLQFKRLNEREYIFEGKINLNDFYRITNLQASDFKNIRSESDTLAGLLLEIIGYIPSVNEVIQYENYEFTILELDNFRIKKIKFSIL